MTAPGSATLPQPPPPAWLLSYEQAQEHASRAARTLARAAEPKVDLKPGASAIKRGLASLFAAMDQRGDRLADTRAALGYFDQAVALLSEAADDDPLVAHAQKLLAGARQHAGEAEAHFSRLPAAAPLEPRPLRASQLTLSLHDVPRASLSPVIKVPEPPPPPPLELPPLQPPKNVVELGSTMAAVKDRAAQRRQAREERAADRQRVRLEAAASGEPPPGFSVPIDPALSEFAFARERLRECFEEVAMLGSQRLPQLGDDWRSVDFLDKRMMANVDAVASLGAAALHAIEEMVIDSPVKDPTRCFGAVLLLGCVDGRDTLAAAERIIRHLDAGDAEVAGYASHALALVPHPHLGLALRSWLADSHEAYRAVAVEVLARRGLATAEELLVAARDPSDRVASGALPALALIAPQMPDLGTVLVEAASQPARAPAAWRAMALCHHPRALREPLDALDGPLADEAGMALALVCDASAAASLQHRCLTGPTPTLVEALGLAGSVASVDKLIELLRHDDAEVVEAAAYALFRITGIELLEEAEIAPDKIMVPEPPLPELGDLEPPAPLAQQVSDPRDLPSDGSPDTIVRPSTEPLRWRQEWDRRRSDVQEGARYRRGRPYTPLMSLWELSHGRLTAVQRRYLQQELVVRSGHHVHFDTAGLLAQQELALREWDEVLRSSSSGGWSRPPRRS